MFMSHPTSRFLCFSWRGKTADARLHLNEDELICVYQIWVTVLCCVVSFPGSQASSPWFNTFWGSVFKETFLLHKMNDGANVPLAHRRSTESLQCPVFYSDSVLFVLFSYSSQIRRLCLTAQWELSFQAVGNQIICPHPQAEDRLRQGFFLSWSL